MAILETIRVSKNTKTQWTTLNPILGNLEIGVEKGTNLFKIGNGVNHWNTLPYVVTGNQNALFIFLSDSPDNLLTITTDGGISLKKSVFNGVDSYNAGVQQGSAAPAPVDDYNHTLLKVGQDVNFILASLATITNRVTQVEGFEEGVKNDDARISTLTTWSSSKIADYILNKNLDLKNELTNNANGAYDALERLADLLQNNTSLALTVTEELGSTVRFNSIQTLTEEQKTQAKQNISAVGKEEMAGHDTMFLEYTSNLVLGAGSPFEDSEM